MDSVHQAWPRLVGRQLVDMGSRRNWSTLQLPSISSRFSQKWGRCARERDSAPKRRRDHDAVGGRLSRSHPPGRGAAGGEAWRTTAPSATRGCRQPARPTAASPTKPASPRARQSTEHWRPTRSTPPPSCERPAARGASNSIEGARRGSPPIPYQTYRREGADFTASVVTGTNSILNLSNGHVKTIPPRAASGQPETRAAPRSHFLPMTTGN